MGPACILHTVSHVHPQVPTLPIFLTRRESFFFCGGRAMALPTSQPDWPVVYPSISHVPVLSHRCARGCAEFCGRPAGAAAICSPHPAWIPFPCASTHLDVCGAK